MTCPGLGGRSQDLNAHECQHGRKITTSELGLSRALTCAGLQTSPALHILEREKPAQIPGPAHCSLDLLEPVPIQSLPRGSWEASVSPLMAKELWCEGAEETWHAHPCHSSTTPTPLPDSGLRVTAPARLKIQGRFVLPPSNLTPDFTPTSLLPCWAGSPGCVISPLHLFRPWIYQDTEYFRRD
eukprot:XP_017449998.1 PREDICTED: uncharacterized protein LOC103692699 isoform X3 [Rattus norvegicus]